MKLFSFTAILTAYRPINLPIEGGPLDVHGRPLQTLQAWLNQSHCIVEDGESVEVEGQAGWVSVAMDLSSIPFGTLICIPILNARYGRQIPFQVCDTGAAFTKTGWDKIDICTRSKDDMFDESVNGEADCVAWLKE